MTLLTHLEHDLPDEFGQAVALGKIPGWRIFRKFGRNPDIDAGTEDVWGYGGTRTLPTTAAVISVVSDNTADDADTGGGTPGTGALTVRFEGLDGNYDEVAETVSMDGTTPVTTTQTFLRVHRAYVVTAGTGLINAGTITGTVGGNVQVSIQPSTGQTLVGMYTVPRNHTLVITEITASTGRIGNLDMTFQLQQRIPNGNINSAPWRVVTSVDVYEGAFQEHCHIKFSEKTELRARGISTGANLTLSVVLRGYLIDNRVL